MKKVAIIVLSVILLVTLGVGVSEYIHYKNVNGVKLPDDEILLVNRYVNYDGVCIDYGIFVDSNGGIYSFDLSQSGGGETNEELLEELQAIRDSKEPDAMLDSDIVKELYWDISQVNANAKFEKEHIAYDAGLEQLMICDVETQELVVCREIGCYLGKSCDTYARKVVSLYDSMISKVIQNGKEE